MLLQLVITSLLLVAGRASVLQGLEEIRYAGGSYRDDRQHTEARNDSNVIRAPLSTPIVPPLYNSSGAPMANSVARWVFAQRGQVPYGALPANDGWQGQEPMYVARTHHAGSMIPGKLQSSFGQSYVSWGNEEHPKQQYEVLVGGSNRWVSTSGGHIPSNALPGGESERGELLYICRVNHNGIVTGKAQQSEGTCYVPYGWRELRFTQYEILLA